MKDFFIKCDQIAGNCIIIEYITDKGIKKLR